MSLFRVNENIIIMNEITTRRQQQQQQPPPPPPIPYERRYNETLVMKELGKIASDNVVSMHDALAALKQRYEAKIKETQSLLDVTNDLLRKFEFKTWNQV